MSTTSSSLTFFCEMCNQPIERNTCSLHGIDFVTIKKISDLPQADRGKVKKIPPKSSSLVPAKPENKPAVERSGQDYEPAPPSTGKPASLPEPKGVRSRKNPTLPRIEFNTPATETPEPVEDAEVIFPIEIEEEGQPKAAGFPDASSPDSQAGYYQTRAPKFTRAAPKTPPKKRSRLTPSLLLVFLLIITASAVGYFVIKQNSHSPGMIYARAEKLLSQGKSPEAQQLYNEFLDRYPDDVLAPIVQSKIEHLEQAPPKTDAPGNDEKHLSALLDNAQQALREGRYTSPPDNNVLYYTNKVLEINPRHPGARMLREKLFVHFQNEAQAALDQEQYNKAITYYQTQLEIKPGDPEVINLIHEALTRKGQTIRR